MTAVMEITAVLVLGAAEVSNLLIKPDVATACLKIHADKLSEPSLLVHTCPIALVCIISGKRQSEMFNLFNIVDSHEVWAMHWVPLLQLLR